MSATRACALAALLVVPAAALHGCGGAWGSSRNGGASPERSAATASLDDDGADGRAPGSVPPGAMTADEIAAQVERDLDEFQRLKAGGRGKAGAAGGASPGADVEGGMSAGAAPQDRWAPSPAAEAARRSAAAPASPDTANPGPQGAAPVASIDTADGAEGRVEAETLDPGAPTPPPRVARRTVPETPEALAGAAAALYRDASRADTPLRSLMALAALSIADPDRPFNAEALPDLTEEERRTLARFHGFCRELGRQLAASDDPEAVSRAVEQLSREMRGERRLRIPRGEVCTTVEGFGVFTAIEPPEFVAHSGARFILYCEIDGYRSVEVGGEGWKTELSVELAILSERDGVPVWRRDWQTVTDLAASQRKDFFMTFRINLPDALSVGAYVMKIRVRDEQTGALAEYSVPFRMVAAPSSGLRE